MWTGTQCACPAGKTWNGTECITPGCPPPSAGAPPGSCTIRLIGPYSLVLRDDTSATIVDWQRSNDREPCPPGV